MQAVELGHVTVLVIRIVSVNLPLLELAEATDLHRRDAVESGLDSGTVFRVFPEYFRCLKNTGEGVVQNLVVVGAARADWRTFAHRAVLRAD